MDQTDGSSIFLFQKQQEIIYSEDEKGRQKQKELREEYRQNITQKIRNKDIQKHRDQTIQNNQNINSQEAIVEFSSENPENQQKVESNIRPPSQLPQKLIIDTQKVVKSVNLLKEENCTDQQAFQELQFIQHALQESLNAQNHLKVMIQLESANILYKIFFNSQNLDFKIIILKIFNQFLSGGTIQTQFIVDFKIHINETQTMSGLQFFSQLLNQYTHQDDNLVMLKLIMSAIGNIIGTKQEYKEFFIKFDIYNYIINLIDKYGGNYPDSKSNEYSILKHSIWALYCLTKEQCLPGYSYEQHTLSTLINLFNIEKDDDMLVDLIWSINSIIENHLGLDECQNSPTITYLLECSIIEMIKIGIANLSSPIITAALRIYNQLYRGDQATTNAIINLTKNDILPQVYKKIRHTHRFIRVECLKNLQQLTLNPELSHDIISPDIIQQIILRCSQDDIVVQIDCLKVLANIMINFNYNLIFLYTNNDLYEILRCSSDKEKDPDVIYNALNVLDHMIQNIQQNQQFKILKKDKQYFQMMENFQLIQQCNDLQQHMNDKISGKAIEIMNIYTQDQDQDEYGLYDNNGIELE